MCVFACVCKCVVVDDDDDTNDAYVASRIVSAAVDRTNAFV